MQDFTRRLAALCAELPVQGIAMAAERGDFTVGASNVGSGRRVDAFVSGEPG
jgi:hypothetical protein